MNLGEIRNLQILKEDNRINGFLEGYYACMQDNRFALADVPVEDTSDFLQAQIIARALEALKYETKK